MKRETVLTGVKVLVAIVSGVAVFFGISHVGDNKPQQRDDSRNSADNSNQPSIGGEIVRDLRRAQNTSSNAAQFLGALSSVAEKGLILFGKAPVNYGRCNSYGDYPNDIRLRRRSTYVLEAVGGGDVYDDNFDNHYGEF